MDQVKIILELVKKHHFWALCALVIVVGLSVWTTASGNLARQFAQRRSKLDGDLKKVQQIRDQADPPNAKVIEASRAQHVKLKDDVLGAWTFLYEQQKKNNPWPETLGQQFLEVIHNLEKDQEIPILQREAYQVFIKSYLPSLFKIVGARVPQNALETRGSGVGARAGAGAGQKDGPSFGNKVDWDPGDWGRIMNSFDYKTTPSSVQVRLAQEDLWVYRALLGIIDKTNAGATSYDNAAVKRIVNLQIGKEAAPLLQRGQVSAAAAGMGAESGGGPAEMGGEPPAGPSGEDVGGGASSEEDTQLKQGRYVDKEGVPLAAGAAEPFTEFKMMPIRLRLVMDQRKVPDLLAECANSSMPVLVQEVHVGSGVDSARGAARGAAGARMGLGGGGGRGGAMMDGGFGAPGAKSGGAGEEARPYDMDVAIAGIIYIYNPPKYDELGKGAAGDQAAQGAGEGPAPGGAPSEAPAPPR